MMRQGWIDVGGDLAITRQCELAGVPRATIYAHRRPKTAAEDELLLSRLIDEEYTRHPFYGSRRMGIVISQAIGRRINRKCIQRLMQAMDQTACPQPGLRQKSGNRHAQAPAVLLDG